MQEVRIATFNVENLLMRCDFSRAGISDAACRLTAITTSALADRADAVFNVLSEDDRTLTAQALAQAKAEICAVQEVENLVTLTAFDNRYLSRWTGRTHTERILHEGNDGRGIDVGLLSHVPVIHHKSHAARSYASLGITPPDGVSGHDRVFRRDCLEVDVVKDGRVLTLFVCHFKSMHGGRAETRAVRMAEAEGVRAIISERFADPAAAEWIILGDLNDYLEIDGRPVGDSALPALTGDGFGVDLAMLTEPDPAQRWSHHYPGDNTYAALDHMILSPRLAVLNAASKPDFVRVGLPWRAERYSGFRLPGMGWSTPKASDHCPLAATIRFEGTSVTG